MIKTALIARGLSKNGVRSFIETNLEKENLQRNNGYYVFTDEKQFIDKYQNLSVIYIKKTNRVIWDNFLLSWQLLKYQINEVYYPKNIIPIFHFFLPFKKNIYVLDLAFMYKELDAYKWLDTINMKIFLGPSLKIANKVIAISHFTKNEIIKFYPHIKKEKIIVKHLQINPIFKRINDKKIIQKIIKKYNLKLPFVFYCGSISPRKNIFNLLQAFEAIKQTVPHQLYLLSSRWWNADEELNYLNEQKEKRAKIINNVSDEDLAVFYSIADYFVYPSLYEGYGLPVKEAEACGCKVLANNCQALKEVSGTQTKLIDCSNLSNFAKSLKLHLNK